MTSSAKPKSGKRFDSPEQETFLNLWRTYDCLKALEDELFSNYQLSAQQYNALRLLRSVHPASMQTLALGKRLISRGPDTTRMLDRLEQRQLIVRERRSENRRVVEIAITTQGLALLDEMTKTVREASWVEGSEEFTLFGQLFFIYLPRELHHSPRHRRINPPDFNLFREDYHGWYTYYVQWVNG